MVNLTITLHGDDTEYIHMRYVYVCVCEYK